MTRFILASASASRANLLKAADVPFDVVSARVDEEAVKEALLSDGTSHVGIADALAELKAVQVSKLRPSALVLGADQVMVFENMLISKSPNLAAGAELLRRLRGKGHLLISAMVLAKNGQAIWRFHSQAKLTMRDFSDSFLEAYLEEGGETLLAGVGCYRLEGQGIQLFSEIQGDYFAILGLPLLPLLSALRDQGVIAV